MWRFSKKDWLSSLKFSVYIRISLGTYYKADACPLLTKSKMRLSSLYFAQDLPISQEIPGNPNHTLRNVPGQFSNQLLEAFLGLELKSTSLKSHPLVRIVTKKKMELTSPWWTFRYGKTTVIHFWSFLFSSLIKFSYFNSSKHKTTQHKLIQGYWEYKIFPQIKIRLIWLGNNVE